MTNRTRVKVIWCALLCSAACLVTCRSAYAQAVNTLVSPDLFGEQVDVVTPGFMHWNVSAGDVVDPDGDTNDFDNNFGEHAGSVDNPRYSSQAYAYGAGNVAEEFVYAVGGDEVYWEFNVPGSGQYVFATRYWKEFSGTADAVASYNNGTQWIDLPTVSNIGHWGGYGQLSCYLIDIPAGQTTVPMRIRASSGRVLIYRLLLAKRKESEEFLPSPAPTHPSMHFHSTDIPAMQSRVMSGPPKRCYDYMVNAVGGYISNHDSGSWTPQNSSHSVPRSIAQTAFVYVMTGNDYYYNAVIRMIDTVIGWNRSDNVINGSWNVLGRGRIIAMIALAYDWLYDRMSVAERDRIGALLAEEANRLYLYNETIVGNLESGNWGPWIGAGYGMAGIALRNEHKWPTQWVDSEKRIFSFNLHSSGEDFGYFNNGFTKAIDFGISLKTATGEDLFAPEAAWLTKLMDYRMTVQEPMGGAYPTFGDASSKDDPLLALVVATYQQDQMSQWFINNLSCGSSSQVNSWAWEHMMAVAVVTTYDPTLGEQAPSEPRLSLAKSFFDDPQLCPGLGVLSVMRTGYGNTNDVQLAMRCGPYLAWHGHPCQGNFVLNAYGDRLVIDKALGGTYGSGPSNFSKTTEAHSQVFVDGMGQVEYSGPVYYNHEAGYIGPMTSSLYADHVQAEMAVAYRKGQLGKMEHAYRDFLFIRKGGQDAYVVVVDDLKTDSSSHSYKWTLQTDFDNNVTSGGSNHSIVDGSADMDVFTIEPAIISTQVTTYYDIWRTITVTNPQSVVRGTFLTVLFPRPNGTLSPQVTRIDEGQLVGFMLDDDLVLFHKGTGVWQYLGIQSDARLLFLNTTTPNSVPYLLTDATTLVINGEDVFSSTASVNATGTYVGNVDFEPPTITGWYSAADHARGIGEALLVIPDDGSFSEPRSSGINRLVLQFSEEIDPVGFSTTLVEVAGLDANNQSVNLSGIAITTQTRGDDTAGEIIFTPTLPNYARYLVRISGPVDLAGNVLVGDNDRIMTGLIGDTYGDLYINVIDLSRVRTYRTGLIDPINSDEIRADISSDGRVNAIDLSRIRPHRANDARTINDPN